MITARDVEQAAFGRAKPGTSGYDEANVDDFLDRAVETLQAIEYGKPLPLGALTSTDVVEAAFAEKGADVDGGYDLDEVDDLLDRVAQRLFDHEKKHGGARRIAEKAGAGQAAEVQPEREDFRDEPAIPELQDSPRSWDEEPRSEEQETIVAEPVEQYPATDRQVPLPSTDVRSKMSDEDLRAQQNYHPEYSEYDADAAASRQEQAVTSEPETPGAVESREPVTPVEPVSVETISAERREPESATLGSMHDATVAKEPASQAPEHAVGQDVTPATPVVGQEATATPEPASATELEAAAIPPRAPETPSPPVERPETIARPEPIDRPHAVPKRDDKSRKGFFRRIFKG